MDTKRIKTQLEKAQKEIGKALEALDKSLAISVEHDPEQIRGYCIHCKVPVLRGEKLIRSMCQSCYNRLNAAARKKGVSIDELVGEGVLPPKQKGGRPSADAEQVIATIFANIEDRRNDK